jgi:hypothetical protein
VSRSRTLEEDVKHDPSVFLRPVGGDIPLQHGASPGAASVAIHLGPADTIADPSSKYIMRAVHLGDILVAVGGDPQHPEMSVGTCAISTAGSLHWSAAVPPGGYRSSVAYNAEGKTWITVGPNGTDISTDEGRSWRALKPSPGEPADTDSQSRQPSPPAAFARVPARTRFAQYPSLATPLRRCGSSRAIGDGGVTEDGAMGTACGGCGDDLARQPRLWEREEVKRARRSQCCRCHGDAGVPAEGMKTKVAGTAPTFLAV